MWLCYQKEELKEIGIQQILHYIKKIQFNSCDYFGRKLVSRLTEHITVGVINDTVAGCSIDMFDEDKSKSYLSTTADWLKNIMH